MDNVSRRPTARQASGGDSPRRPRVPWRFLTKLFGFLAALLGLLRILLER